jgi:hypothetical protein
VCGERESVCVCVWYAMFFGAIMSKEGDEEGKGICEIE